MKIIQKILWYFSPCRKCKDKDVEGLVACSCTKGMFEKKYRLSDKVRKQRLKRWICLISQIIVFVVGFAIGFFYLGKPLGLGLATFAIWVLIECIRETE